MFLVLHLRSISVHCLPLHTENYVEISSMKRNLKFHALPVVIMANEENRTYCASHLTQSEKTVRLNDIIIHLGIE